MKLRIISDISLLKGKHVLVRVDFNVAIERGRILEDFKITEALPTIRYLLKRGVCIRLMSHLGRPGGKPAPECTLLPVVKYLERILKRNIIFLRNPFSQGAFRKYKNSPEIIFFENLRFWKGEEGNDRAFMKGLARWGDYFVNEAFSNSHRNQASMTGIAEFLPAYAGLHVAREVIELERMLKNPVRPVAAILGGVKIETKLPLIERFLRSGASVLVGGALANTLFSFTDTAIGKSRIDTLDSRTLRRIKKTLAFRMLFLPLDATVGTNLQARGRVISLNEVRDDDAIYDIGPKTVSRFLSILKRAKTIIWNGPLGVAEERAFSKGTVALAKIMPKLRAYKIIGGGDTIAVLRKYRVLKGFSHISTGGGAMLEFLAGKKLPAIEVLRK